MYEDLVFYITRDKDGSLRMHSQTPRRYGNRWVCDGDMMDMNYLLYEGLSFNDEPLKVILRPAPEVDNN